MIVDERAVRPAPAPARPEAAARPASPWTPLAAVLALLPVAALTELSLTRTFYRVGIYIPREGPFRSVYAILTEVGSFAFNLSAVLAVLAIGLLAAAAGRRGRMTVAVVLSAFLAAVLLTSLSGSYDLGPTARLTFVLAVGAVAWPFVRSLGPTAERLAVAGVALAAALSAYAGLVGDAARLLPSSDGPGGATAAQLAGEAVVVATAFALFAAWAARDGLRPWPVALGAIPAAALIVAWKANGAVTGILVLWTAGLRLYLPVWLYALALGAFAAAAVGWLPRRPWRAAGLSLLFVGGFLLESTYLQSLAVIALVLLTDGLAVGGLPDLPGRRKAAVP